MEIKTMLLNSPILTNAASFLLQTFFGLLTLLLLLRFLLQWVRAPFQNPLFQAIITLTNFAVKPMRKWLPSWLGLDLSTLFLAFITQLILNFCLFEINQLMLTEGNIWLHLIIFSAINILKLSLYILIYATLIQALLSWINPHNTITPILNSLTNPALKPLKNRFTYLSGIDFSPFILLIIAELIMIVIILPLEAYWGSLL